MKNRIILMTHQLLIMTALKALIESKEGTGDIVDLIADPQDIWDSIEVNHPTLLIMDAKLKKQNSIQLTKKLVAKYPDLKIVVLTSQESEEIANYFTAAGALVVISKEKSENDLIKVLQEPPKKYKLKTRRHLCTKPTSYLTQMEQTILTLVSEDKTNFEISQLLNVSKRTIEYHVSSIIHKLHVDSRVGAVVKGLRLGVIGDYEFIPLRKEG